MKLGKYQSQTFNTWAGLTKKSHMGSIMQVMPQKAKDHVMMMFAAKGRKTLETFLSQFSTKYFETGDEYTWDLAGETERNIVLVEARDENGKVIDASNTGMIGAGVAPFYLVFSETQFFDGDVIVGELNEVYPLRILGDPRYEGTNTIYKVELMGGVTEGMPAERLQPGERFSYEYNPVEQELSRKVGDIGFNAPISMRNEWTTLRLQHKVSAHEDLRKKMAWGLPVVKRDAKGNKQVVVENVWMHYEEWVFETKWSEAKNKARAFGKSNRDGNGEYLNIGKSGEVIRMGDGIYPQMEAGNVIPYNAFDEDFPLKQVEDALYALSANKKDLNDRIFTMKTGQAGAIQFHKAIKKDVSGWQGLGLTVNADAVGMINKVQSPLHKNALSVGFQFVEYLAPNGIVLRVEVDPYYDDQIRNKITINGKPAFSYRYDILDLGSANEPNIQLCEINGSPERRGYEWGPFYNPFTGSANNNSASTDEDSATMHVKGTFGTIVWDPTRCFSIIPSVLIA